MSERLADAQMAAELEKLVQAKATWLASFGDGRHKRPDFELDIRRRELAVLRQAAADYRRGLAEGLRA